MEAIIDKITAQECRRQVITITGMGGIGKSTLAKNVYGEKVIAQHFDIRGSIRVSQEFDVQEIFLGLLQEFGVPSTNKLNKAELGLKLYQLLCGRRYLIVIDDIWNLEAWEEINRFLPSESNRSRILITTRLSNLASKFGSSYIHEMELLDNKQSWTLLCKKVFVQEQCCSRLKSIGKEIANSCRGLPLSIIVIGGLLTKSRMLDFWEHVASNVSSLVNLTDEERCLKVLYMSYDHLPIHLKSCFLYLGLFPEDHEICVPQLIHLWVAEGFLKPMEDRSSEDVAYHYLNDLIGRNLIFSSHIGITGNVKYCRIHDLLRDLCLEVGKENFLHVTSIFDCPYVAQVSRSERRLAYGDMPIGRHHTISNRDFILPVHLIRHGFMRMPDLFPEFDPNLLSTSLRSLISQVQFNLEQSVDVKLMRVCVMEHGQPERVFSKLLNSRYLDFGRVKSSSRCIIPRSINLLWNLETIILNQGNFVAPYEIWEMPQLRHIMIWNLLLTDPCDGPARFVLENLQTLLKIVNFRCTEEVIKRIPNVKKLKMIYEKSDMLSSYCLSNLRCLDKLVSLCCYGPSIGDQKILLEFFITMEFPLSLKELKLHGLHFSWEDMAAKIGPLPCLQVLKVVDCYTNDNWCVVENEFPCLKYLKIQNTNLVDWEADDIHFPCLERLVLWDMESELQIPSGIGSIPTLEMIDVEGSSKTIIDSAKEILKQQREFCNMGLELINENWAQENNATAVTMRTLRNTQAPVPVPVLLCHSTLFCFFWFIFRSSICPQFNF